MRNRPHTGLGSTAIGLYGEANGENSMALGFSSRANGRISIAMGENTEANGLVSTSMGLNTHANGNLSTTMGGSTYAVGEFSIATGQSTRATGSYSTSLGIVTNARSYASVVMGQCNDSIAGSSTGGWINTDPLLILGNGTSATTPSNAVVVYKNGNTYINGYTKLGKLSEAAPAIKMKEFSAYCAVTQNTWRDVAHSLTVSKILSVNILVDTTPGFADQIPPSYTHYSGYEYHYHISATNIVVINLAANSFNILNKPLKILVNYKE